MAEKEKVAKKRPTALKRDLQNTKKRLQNKAFKSQVKTAISTYKKSLKNNENESSLTEKLNTIYSLMDKGVKRGIYKKGASARVKSRLHCRLSKQKSK